VRQQRAGAADGSALTVGINVEGEPSTIGPSASLAAYRVVQESITNARKHSHAREVAVSLAWCPDQLVVEVTDPGPPRRSHPLPGAGMGLQTMAERVRAVGGTAEAGRSASGFAVRGAPP